MVLGKWNFCLGDWSLQMTKQGQLKIKRTKQCERHAFWWTLEFVSVELFNVKKYMLKQGKFWKFSKVTAKPKAMENSKGYGNSHGKSWNLKTSKEYFELFYLLISYLENFSFWCLLFAVNVIVNLPNVSLRSALAE